MICSKCNLDKGTDFRYGRTVCRECDNAAAREYRKTLKDKPKPDFIICKLCKKQTSDFQINRKNCADCERARGREYRKTTDTAKIWVENNRDKMRELNRVWQGNAMKTDEKFRIATNHKTAISSMLSGRSKTSKHLNCNSTRLINWMEFQFNSGMTLENHNELWVVDHVIPIYYYRKKDVDQDVVLNWINLTPLLKKENATKHKNIDREQCEKHIETVKSYYRIRNITPDLKYLEQLTNFAKHLDAGTPLPTSISEVESDSDVEVEVEIKDNISSLTKAIETLKISPESVQPRASTTHSVSETNRGTRLIAEPKGKNVEDGTIRRRESLSSPRLVVVDTPSVSTPSVDTNTSCVSATRKRTTKKKQQTN